MGDHGYHVERAETWQGWRKVKHCSGRMAQGGHMVIHFSNCKKKQIQANSPTGEERLGKVYSPEIRPSFGTPSHETNAPLIAHIDPGYKCNVFGN